MRRCRRTGCRVGTAHVGWAKTLCHGMQPHLPRCPICRHTLGELQAMVDACVALFPAAAGHVEAALRRVPLPQQPPPRVKLLGPVCYIEPTYDYDSNEGKAAQQVRCGIHGEWFCLS